MKRFVVAGCFIMSCAITAVAHGATAQNPSSYLQNDLARPWPETPTRALRLTGRSDGVHTMALPERQTRCLGPQNLLVIRVDFSDLSGQPVAAATAQQVLDQQVKPFLERNSYGKTTIVSTVSSKVYRMPRTAEVYMMTEPDDGYGEMSRQLWLDAVEAAQADYATDNFSRIIVTYSPELGTKFPQGKWIASGGMAILSDAKMWIGDFSLAVVAHELCHTYGAQHSNRWVGTASSPVGFGGHIDEYQDPTDLMGRGLSPDCDLAPWQKYLCGWLPDSAIGPVSQSGSYRVYRFDVADADLTRPVVLQFSQDGIHYYSVALRGGLNASSGQALTGTASGAYIGFTYYGNDPFNMVDLAPPYDDPKEVVLPIGSSLSDSAAGVTLEVKGKGGSGRDSYLDVQVTFSKTARRLFVGWGDHQAFETAYVPKAPTELTAVAAGNSHTIGIRPDGAVWVGPEDGLNATSTPAGLADVVAVAAGIRVSGAVRRDGTIALWGLPNYGLTTAPPDLVNVSALAFGERHAIALKKDGTVVMWGTRGNTFSYLPGAGDLPADLHNVVAIGAGDYFSLALKRDGSVEGTDWAGNRVNREYTDLTAIACGSYCALGLRANGTPVLLFSCNSVSGQANIPAGLTDVKAIAVGRGACLALRADGSIVGWGGDNDGGTRPFHAMQVQAPPGIRFAAVDIGSFHSVGIAESVAAPIVSRPVRSNGKVTVSWSASPGVARYLIDVSSLPTFASFVKGWNGYDVGTATSIELAGLDPAASYYCRVRGVSSGGDRSISNIGVIAAATPIVLPAVAHQAPAAGSAAALTLEVPTGASCQWRRNGGGISDATAGTLNLQAVRPSDAGLYTALVTTDATEGVSEPAIVGLQTDLKVLGDGSELSPANVRHPNGNVFDQIALTGPAESITADYAQRQATRTSFIDLDGDIVQVEFSGPGTLSLVIDQTGSPAEPEKYHQPGVQYVKGHAGIVITGATEETNLSVFTVGRATAFDPTGAYDITKAAGATNDPAKNGSPLFTGHSDTSYDGFAGVSFVAISSRNGKFGGLRTANTHYFASKGYTGVYAPGVEFTGPVYIGDISAYDTARPMIVLGSASNIQITGGDMLQDNGQPVTVSGISRLQFADGSDSHGHIFKARANDAKYLDHGIDVTSQIVSNL